MRRCSGLGLGLSLLVGCAGPSPQDALSAYAGALAEGDAQALHQGSDAATRAAHEPGEMKDALRRAPADNEALAQQLREAELTLYAEARLKDGRVVRLVREPAGWKVAAGGLALARYDSPEAALETLVRAVRAGSMQEVRGAMPSAFSARYADDQTLAAYLHTVKARLEGAWQALSPLVPGRAEVNEDRAVLRYGSGRSVRFVREGPAWRVLDVE